MNPQQRRRLGREAKEYYDDPNRQVGTDADPRAVVFHRELNPDTGRMEPAIPPALGEKLDSGHDLILWDTSEGSGSNRTKIGVIGFEPQG
jgi:hypothetical protein